LFGSTWGWIQGLFHLSHTPNCFGFCLFVHFWGNGVWTQGLHFEPLHQPFFVKGFFEIGSRELFAWASFELWSSWSLLLE
jgi:hypothetical protein